MQNSKVLKRLVALGTASLCLGVLVSMSLAAGQDEAKPKYTLKDIMKQHKKGGLLPKILSGEGTAEDKTALLDMYISMFETKPPKGEMDSWQHLAGASTLAAAKVVVGREGAIDELKKATNCAACHKVHKPS